MKFIFFVLLVGIAASCPTHKCIERVNLTKISSCITTGDKAGEELKRAKTKADMNEAYKKLCKSENDCPGQVERLLTADFDCDCFLKEGRISAKSLNQVCEQDDGDFFGTLLLAAITIPRQCNGLGEAECSSNSNCFWPEATKSCNFNPNEENLKEMCTDKLLEYLLKNPTGGTFSGGENTPTLLATVLTFCLKHDDSYCILSDTKLPLKMETNETKTVCENSTKLACARSRLATVAASFRVEAIKKKLNGTSDDEVKQSYVIANSLDKAAQDLCVKTDDGYCLVDASKLVNSKCYQNCTTEGCTDEEKKAPKTILTSPCGATVKKDNLLLSNNIPPMAMLYPFSAVRLDIPELGDYDAIELQNKGDEAATDLSNKITDKFAECVNATIPQDNSASSNQVLGTLVATISTKNATLKDMLPFFIKTDLAIQLGVPYYTLSLESEGTNDVQFYLDNDDTKVGGIKYTISINAEETIVNAAKKEFKKKSEKLPFYLTGAFLSINGNGKYVSGVRPLFLTEEQLKSSDNTSNTTTTTPTSEGVSETTLLLAIATVMVALFAL